MAVSLLANSFSYLQKSNFFLSRLLMLLAMLPVFYYSSVVAWQLIYPQGFQHKVQTVNVASQSVNYTRSKQSWSWFIDSSVPKAPPPPPPSKIDAKLLGVIAQGGAEGGRGVALIAVKNKPAVYSVGDELSPGVVLESVASFFVTLKRGDISEILEMKKTDSIFKSGGNQQTGAGGSRSAGLAPSAPTALNSAQQIKAMLVEKPGKILEAVQIERYQDQRHGAGFRIRPRKGHEAVLSMLGLNSDDVLLSVNGRNVTQINVNPKNVAAMMGSGPIKLKVLRGGSITEVVVH